MSFVVRGKNIGKKVWTDWKKVVHNCFFKNYYLSHVVILVYYVIYIFLIVECIQYILWYFWGRCILVNQHRSETNVILNNYFGFIFSYLPLYTLRPGCDVVTVR